MPPPRRAPPARSGDQAARGEGEREATWQRGGRFPVDFLYVRVALVGCLSAVAVLGGYEMRNSIEESGFNEISDMWPERRKPHAAKECDGEKKASQKVFCVVLLWGDLVV